MAQNKVIAGVYQFTLHSATIKISISLKPFPASPIFTLHSATIKMLFCFI